MINKFETINKKGLSLIDRFLVENLKIHEKLNLSITHLTFIHDIFRTLKEDEFFTLDKDFTIQKIPCNSLTVHHVQDLFNQLFSLLSAGDENKEEVDFLTIMTVHEKVDLILQCIKDHPSSQIKILESKELTKQFHQLHTQAFNIPFDTKPMNVLQDYLPQIKHPYLKEFFKLNLYKHDQEKIKIHKEKSEKELIKYNYLIKNIKYSKTTEILTSLSSHHTHLLEDIFAWNSIFFMNIDAGNFLYSSPLQINSPGFDKCVKAIMDFSEKLNFLMRSYLLAPKTLKKRVKTLTLCIEMIDKLIVKEDLHGAFTLYSALNSPEISRLSDSFENLNQNTQKLLKNHSWLFSSRKNFKVYRNLLISCKSPIPIFQLLIKDNTIGNENSSGEYDEINLYKWKFYYNQYKMVKDYQNKHQNNFMAVKMRSNLYQILLDIDIETFQKKLFERSYKIRPLTRKIEITDANTDPKN